MDALERELTALHRRVRELERVCEDRAGRRAGPLAGAARRDHAGAPADRHACAVPGPLPARPQLNLEELLGRRLLALVGGAAFLLGLAFFVALAVEHGWIGETARVVLAFLASGGRSPAAPGSTSARAASRPRSRWSAAESPACTSASPPRPPLYHLIPTPVALLGAVAIGACAAAIAVRWDSRTVAGLGIVGTLLAPLLATTNTTAAIAFLLVAWAAASAVCLWRRWDWLALLAFAVAMPQIAVWTFSGHSPAAIVAVLSAAAALDLAAAVGFELRVRAETLRPSAVLLSLFGALIVGALGFYALPHTDGAASGAVWVSALAAAHGLLGLGVLRLRRGRELALVLLAIGLTLADIAFGVIAHGVVLAAVWAASAAALAGITRRLGLRDELISLTVGAQLALAIGHTLLFDAPPGAIAGGSGGLTPAAALGAIVVAAFAAARLAGTESKERRMVLDALAMVALAALSAAVVDGLALVAAWAFEATVLAEAGRRTKDPVATAGAFGFLGLAAAHVLVFEAPPDGLLYGSNDLLRRRSRSVSSRPPRFASSARRPTSGRRRFCRALRRPRFSTSARSRS